MDKYEFKLKINEMKALVSANNYKAAAEIAETINWRKVRGGVNAMVLAGEIFEKVGRYEESKEILLMAYDKAPIGRNIIYRLAEIAIKTKKFEEAQEYYDEFVEIAPHDNLKYILKYKMTAASGKPYKEQIEILEELREQEISEEWSYELAYLYHMDGQPEKCVEICDDLTLYFNDGIYVEKALELKMHYQPLNKRQENQYRLFRQKRTGIIEVKPDDFLESGEIVNETVSIPSVVTNADRFNTANLQQEIERGMQQIMEAQEKEDISDAMNSIKKVVEEVPYLSLPEEGESEHQEKELAKAREDEIDRQMDLSLTQRLNAVNQQPSKQPTQNMSIEDILAEWEKTKQATQEVLHEAEEKKLESAKEQALQEAETLMDRLMNVMPQLTAGMTSRDLLEQKYLQGIETGQNQDSDGVAQNLEEATRIVADMNQIMQQQIDNLSADQQKKEEMSPAEPRNGSNIQNAGLEPDASNYEENTLQSRQMTDPTRELPELPQEALEEQTDEFGDSSSIRMEDYLDTEQEEKNVDNREQFGQQEDSRQVHHVQSGLTEQGQYDQSELTEQGQYDQSELTEQGQYNQSEYAEQGRYDQSEHTEQEQYGQPEFFEEGQYGQPEISGQEQHEQSGFSEQDRYINTGIAGKKESAEYPEFPEEEQNELPIERGQKTKNIQSERFTQETTAQQVRMQMTGPLWYQRGYTTELPDLSTYKDGYVTEERRKTKELQNSKKQLTPEQRQIFSYFVPIATMEGQIYDVLEGVSRHLKEDKNSLSGNIVIEGISGSGKTVLIMNLIKALQHELKRPNGKIGKIDATSLNQKDMKVLVEKVSGGCLIIESAGKITRETAVRLSECMERDNTGTLYVMEDTPTGIQKALERDKSFAKKFTERIKIPYFTSDELVAFGKAYANDLDYDIDEMGILALYNRISSIQKLDHVTTLTEVKEIVDAAIDRAEKGAFKKVLGMLTSTRYNDENYVVLREKDFQE